LIDSLSIKPGDTAAVLVVPVGLLVAYAVLRLSTSLFTELRELIFAKATEGAARSISLQVFRHLHALSLRFHLERQTGGMTRDIERGTRAVHSLISYSLYSIFPTLVEVAMVLTLLAWKFDAAFAWITLAALVVYITFTITVTEWRTQFRKEMNELDSKAHTRAIDSLLNYETVKYFNNEEYEAQRYDRTIAKWFPIHASPNLQGDHNVIVNAALEKLRREYEIDQTLVKRKPVSQTSGRPRNIYAGGPDPEYFFSRPFTLRELQVLHETVAGRVFLSSSSSGSSMKTTSTLRDTFRRLMEPQLNEVGTNEGTAGSRGAPSRTWIHRD
jgi:ABC-type multidrug transport system fused ATPase/permease subunit